MLRRLKCASSSTKPNRNAAKNKSIIKGNMRILLRKLDAAEKSDLGILPILGFRDDIDEEAFQMIFIIPEIEKNTQTLM